jgi:hypothetical protein
VHLGVRIHHLVFPGWKGRRKSLLFW